MRSVWRAFIYYFGDILYYRWWSWIKDIPSSTTYFLNFYSFFPLRFHGWIFWWLLCVRKNWVLYNNFHTNFPTFLFFLPLFFFFCSILGKCSLLEINFSFCDFLLSNCSPALLHFPQSFRLGQFFLFSLSIICAALRDFHSKL